MARYKDKIVNFRMTFEEHDLLKLAAKEIGWNGNVSTLIAKALKPIIDAEKAKRSERDAKRDPLPDFMNGKPAPPTPAPKPNKPKPNKKSKK